MKRTKHFISNKNSFGDGVPACDGYSFGSYKDLYAFSDAGEIAKTRKEVTCKNCRRTRVFKKLK